MEAVYLCALLDMANWDFSSRSPLGILCHCIVSFSFLNSKHASNVLEGSLSFL